MLYVIYFVRSIRENKNIQMKIKELNVANGKVHDSAIDPDFDLDTHNWFIFNKLE